MHFSGFPESLKSQIVATMRPPPNILGLLQTSRFELLGGWNVCSTIQQIVMLQKRQLELLIFNQGIPISVPYSNKTPF